MRPSASIVRKLIQAAPVFLAAVVVLLSDSVAEAATRVQCAARPRAVGSIRHHRPVLAAGSASQIDDQQAIQNDVPAADIDGDPGAPEFRPLGVLAASIVRLLESGAFSPTAPRGPPRLSDAAMSVDPNRQER